MKLILASNNKKKLAEMNSILSGIGFQVISMEEAGIDCQPEETGGTFEENALLKARAAMALSGAPCLADDSGLQVEALRGEPGVRSARYCPGTDFDRVMFLLKNMRGITDRRARFVSAVACVIPGGPEIVTRGEIAGEILEEIRGQGGFGYDPVFFVPEEGKTFAEMDPVRKNTVSHRARALEKMRLELKAIEAAGREGNEKDADW